MTPGVVRFAGYLVTLEGLCALVAAAVFVIRGLEGADQHIVNGWGNAIWFGIMGAAVLSAGWGLTVGRRWGRGIAVFANLLLLGVAWYISSSEQPFYAVAVAAAALVTLGLLFSPAAVQWVSRTDETLHDD